MEKAQPLDPLLANEKFPVNDEEEQEESRAEKDVGLETEDELGHIDEPPALFLQVAQPLSSPETINEYDPFRALNSLTSRLSRMTDDPQRRYCKSCQTHQRRQMSSIQSSHLSGYAPRCSH